MAPSAGAHTQFDWNVLTMPTINQSPELYGISCVSTTWCWAVGGRQPAPFRDLTYQWKNAGPWQAKASPRIIGSMLYGVSCPSKQFCMAVGGVFIGGVGTTLALKWTPGPGWVRVTTDDTPQPSPVLYSVSCLSPTFCMAVGATMNNQAPNDYPSTAIAEVWNGANFTVTAATPPAPTGFSQVTGYALFGVDCAHIGPGYCYAVGGLFNFSGPVMPLTDRWLGPDAPGSWSIVKNPAPYKVPTQDEYHPGAVYWGVSCGAIKGCAAVGYDSGGATGPPFPATPLASWWKFNANPVSPAWKVVPSIAGTSGASVLYGVSCRHGSTCIAVGADGLDFNPPYINQVYCLAPATPLLQKTMVEGGFNVAFTGFNIPHTPDNIANENNVLYSVSIAGQLAVGYHAPTPEPDHNGPCTIADTLGEQGPVP